MTDAARPVPLVPFAELHARSAFSFLRATSTPEGLVEQAVALGLNGLALVDEGSLSGAVRFVRAAETAGLPALLGVEFEMADPAVPDRDGVVLPLPRGGARGFGSGAGAESSAGDGRPDRPLPERQRRHLDELVPPNSARRPQPGGRGRFHIPPRLRREKVFA